VRSRSPTLSLALAVTALGCGSSPPNRQPATRVLRNERWRFDRNRRSSDAGASATAGCQTLAACLALEGAPRSVAHQGRGTAAGGVPTGGANTGGSPTRPHPVLGAMPVGPEDVRGPMRLGSRSSSWLWNHELFGVQPAHAVATCSTQGTCAVAVCLPPGPTATAIQATVAKWTSRSVELQRLQHGVPGWPALRADGCVTSCTPPLTLCTIAA